MKDETSNQSSPMCDSGFQTDQEPLSGTTHYEFGSFHFDPEAAWLCCDGRRVHLPPKETALLTLLISHHGRVVKHRTIWDQLWPQQDVSYESLTRCVYALRRALNDRGGKLITSVPRIGYTFSASTQVIHPRTARSEVEKSTHTVPSAHSLYQLGLHEASLPSLAHQQRAVAFYQRAHELDPSYCVPLGAIAQTSAYQAIRGYLSPADAAAQASDAITRALSIDPELVSALAAKGWFEGVYHGRVQSALQTFDRAQQLDPEHAMTFFARGWVERSAGRMRKAVTALTSACELAPLSLNCLHGLAWALFCCGRGEEALEIERRYTRDMPEIDNGHYYLAIFSAWLGHHDEAVRAAEAGLAISQDDPNALTVLGYALARGGSVERARELADQALTADGLTPILTFLAATYLAIDDEAQALSLLQAARDRRSPWFPSAAFDPRLAPLWDTAAFRALYETVPHYDFKQLRAQQL